ncbi:MAG: alpha/beta fold hydrolase [Actinomycetia bacterium]|nr:alpha/beta fold hydrolase [Actinomycetes bacterium]
MTADSAGERLHAVVHDGDGPFCLLVAGALGTRSYWADNLVALRQVCRPVIAEIWGHGRSPSPVDPGRYGVDALVDEFEVLRQEVGADDWYTIGQSMGAALTLRYGLTHPDRVRAQVITNSRSAFSEPEPWLERNRTMVHDLAQQVQDHGVEVLRQSWINPGRSRRIAQPTRDLLAREFDEHTEIGIAQSLRITNAQLPLGDQLAEVSRPTLMTNGVDEERFQELLPRVRLIPGVEVVDIPAAHAVNAQAPPEWNAAVVAFLRRH